MMRPAIFCLLMVLLSVSAHARAEQVREDPVERRMLSIAKDLRCAVCQNQPVSESNASLAQDMRQIVREQIRAGKSDDDIKRYFVERYGDYVLMKPPARGFGSLVWLGPIVLLGVIATGGFLYLRRRLKPALSPPPALSDEDRDRIERARDEENRP